MNADDDAGPVEGVAEIYKLIKDRRRLGVGVCEQFVEGATWWVNSLRLIIERTKII